MLGAQLLATLICVSRVPCDPSLVGLGAVRSGLLRCTWFARDRSRELLAYRILSDPSKPRLSRKPRLRPGPKPSRASASTRSQDCGVSLEAKAEAKPEAKAPAQREAKPEPKPEAKTAKTEPKSEANTDVATLMNTSLGDVLLAGLAKDPQSVGRIVAQAINQAETPIAVAKAHQVEAELTPEAKPEPHPAAKAAPEPQAKAKTPSASTPQVAKRA